MSDAMELLVVEDNLGDVRLHQEFFKAHKISNRVSYVHNFKQMWEVLRREPQHQEIPLPDMIFLSIRPFLLDGLHCIAEIKHDPRFRSILLVGLTGVDGEEDALGDGAAYFTGYLSKPLDLNKLKSMCARIETIGLEITRQDNWSVSPPLMRV